VDEDIGKILIEMLNGKDHFGNTHRLKGVLKLTLKK
jgi:hypothetical protein